MNEARDLLLELDSRQPATPALRMAMAHTYINLGWVSETLGDLAGSAASTVSAIDGITRLIAEYPDVHDYRYRLALCFMNLSQLVYEKGDYAKAVSSARQGIAIRSKEVTQHPEVPDYWRQSLALACDAAGRTDDAVAAVQNAVAELRQALNQAPKSVTVRRTLIVNSRLLAALLRGQCRSDQAAELLRECPEAGAADKTTAYDLAGALALHARFCHDSALARFPADQAINALREAIHAGFHDATCAWGDPELVALRDRDDFRKLLGELRGHSIPADVFAH